MAQTKQKKLSKIPKKAVLKSKRKTIAHVNKPAPAKRTSRKARRYKTILFLMLLAVIIILLRFMYHTVDVANQVNVSSANDASSLLAYDKSQIETAKVIGPKSQLAQEVKDFSRASSDLQGYITKDYKEFKKECIVNGDFVGSLSYEVVRVVNNKFALLAKGCNGVEDSILAKIGGRWSAIYSGNALITCDQINTYNIPQTISRNCQLNGQIYLNPNP